MPNTQQPKRKNPNRKKKIVQPPPAPVKTIRKVKSSAKPLTSAQLPIGGYMNNPAKPQTIRKSFRSGKSANSMWNTFKSHFGSAAVETMEFCLSPAETSACNGFADDQFFRSSTLTKSDLSKSFGCPNIFKTKSPNSTWSLVLIMLPSVDTPLLAMFINDELIGDKIPWAKLALCGQSDIDDAQAVIHRFSDVAPELIKSRDYNDEGLNLPASFQPASFSETTKRFATYESSNQDQTVANTRLCGMSLTTYLSANATQNKGTVYSTQLPQMPDPKPVTFHVTTFAAENESGTPTPFLTDRVSSNSNVLTGLPATINELDQNGVYTGQAYDGNYTVSKFMGNSKANNLYDHRALLGFQDPERSAVTEDAPLLLTNKATVQSFNNQGVGVDAFVPEMLSIDRSFTPILVYYANLDQSATVKVKMVMGFEFSAVPHSSYHYLMHPSLDMCAEYIELLKGLSAKLPPGAPKSANDFWSTFKSIASTLLNVVTHVAPVLLPLLV